MGTATLSVDFYLKPLYIASMKPIDLKKCRQRLQEYLNDLFTSLGRSERRHWGSVYVRGLLLDGKRKSIEPMANRMPEGNVQAMQQFINQSPWPHEPLRQKLAEKLVREMLPAQAWIIDDTGFPKKGKHSVGVAKQYSGTLGSVGNCQVAVSLNFAVGRHCMPLNFALYLPEAWTQDAARMADAGVPEGTVFQTKFDLAFELIDKALEWDIPRGVVVCDSFYGKSRTIRNGLIERNLDFVAEITSKNAVIWPDRKEQLARGCSGRELRQISVKELALSLPTWKWKTVCWRKGTKKKLVSRFAAIRVDPGAGQREKSIPQLRQWLLIEWPKGVDNPTKYWFSSMNAQTKIRRLVELAKARYLVEQNYQQQKDELGLDHFEGRSWLGWHHHVSMNMVAFGFLLLAMLQPMIATWAGVCMTCKRHTPRDYLSGFL